MSKKNKGGNMHTVCFVTALNNINRIAERDRSILCLAFQKALKEKIDKEKTNGDDKHKK